ncbi:hypothetical protein JCM8097_001969 [Rhodosporidiobolus ruineniae]
MRFLTLASALIGGASVAYAASSTPCVLEGSSIGKIDLRGLRKDKQDYVATNPDGGAISLNFCGSVSSNASPAESAQGYGAYIEDSRGGISLGEYSSTPAYHNGLLSLTYKNGAACPNSNARRSSLIYLQCDNSWSSDNKVTLIDSVDDCTYFFTIKTPYACAVSGGFFSAVWGLLVFGFWLTVVVGGAYFVYQRFFGNRGGYTLGGGNSSGNAVGEAASWVKDIVIISGVWVLDTAQNVFQSVKRRREANASGVYDYNRSSSFNDYQPAPAQHSYRGSAAQSLGGRGGDQPDYSSEAWRATPPMPPSKSPTLGGGHQEPTNPALAGGGSLLEDDEDDEEATLAMPGTKGKDGSLV